MWIKIFAVNILFAKFFKNYFIVVGKRKSSDIRLIM